MRMCVPSGEGDNAVDAVARKDAFTEKGVGATR